MRSVTRFAFPARTMHVGAPLFFDVWPIRVASVGTAVELSSQYTCVLDFGQGITRGEGYRAEEGRVGAHFLV